MQLECGLLLVEEVMHLIEADQLLHQGKGQVLLLPQSHVQEPSYEVHPLAVVEGLSVDSGVGLKYIVEVL